MARTDRGVAAVGCGPGGYTGGVLGGLYRYPQPAARGGPQKQTAKRAPGSLQGLEWGGLRGPDVLGALQHVPTPAGPGRSLWALPGTCLRFRPSWPIGARFDLISHKVSKNHGVSPKSVQKACHSPYITKRVREVAS